MPEQRPQDLNRMVFVDVVTYINKRRKVEKTIIAVPEVDEIVKGKEATVQLSWFRGRGKRGSFRSLLFFLMLFPGFLVGINYIMFTRRSVLLFAQFKTLK